jgi:hypothetical protein
LTIVDANGNPATWGTVGHILDTGATPLGGPGIAAVHAGIAYIPCQVDNCLSIVDVSDPINPVFLASIGGAGAPNYTSGAWHALYRRPGIVYVASVIDNAISIFDVSNPLAPALLGVLRGAGAPNWLGQATTVDVDDNLIACVAARSDNSMTVINVANPAAPVTLGHIAGAGAPNRLSNIRRVIKVGNYVYTCAFLDAAVSVFDVTNPAAPALHGQVVHANLGSAFDMSIYGNYAYVSCQVNPGRVTIIDITNPAAPAYVNAIADARIRSTQGNTIFTRSFPYIYVCGSNAVTDALVWYNVINPAAPLYVSQIVGQGAPNYMGSPFSVTHDIYFPPTCDTQPATEVT